ncbi:MULTISPECIES: hypothetical protein [Streptomyces]|uniref:hypothetical protein n=1 Tax=Streptomyces TaxID=1883 RepID=UPI0012922A38|nr:MULTISPECIES: hypothetical protein [Streptomyces]MCX5037580.1 hypothetical protein [Streptomyces coelicoflavus]QFX83705.1 hypothetical protein GEV49_24520 [Streptomyces sp. SYP-A7193]
MTFTPQQVVDAWQNMQPWVERQLSDLARHTELSDDERKNAGDIRVCQTLDRGGRGSLRWSSDGDASYTLSSQQITALDKVTIKTATTMDESTAHLPFGFSLLEVKGKYIYDQPCAAWDLGKKVTASHAGGQGAVIQAIDDNTLSYVVNTGDAITLESVVIGGTIRVNLIPDSGGMPPWIASLLSFMTPGSQLEGFRSKLQDAFQQGSFTKTMLTLLEHEIRG